VNAPEGGILLQQPTIALSQIVVSKTNPRKTFDKAKHEELTASVGLKGVINPILVRPVEDGHYEVVAGERRFKAAIAAGLAEIPATVKPLTDAEALELQVIENQQREDLHPLEEAEGYEALLKCKHVDGSKYTVDDIATKVGKSKSYVYKKLKLCDCCKEARQAFYSGRIDFSKALLLAQIHGEKLQRQALEEITRPWINGEPMTFRSAQQHVQQTYMLALDKAPFSTKDEKLVTKAGPCTTCPKRTGNAPELFADVKSGDMCTDPPCFSAKRSAHMDRVKEAAIADGRTVITGKAAAKIKPYAGAVQLEGGFVAADRRCFEDAKGRTYAQIVGDSAKPQLLEDPHAKGADLLQVFRLEDIKALLPKAPSRNPASRTVRPMTRQPAESAAEKVREQIFTHVCAKLPTSLGKTELAWLAKDITNADVAFDAIAKRFFPKVTGSSFGTVNKLIPKLDAKNLSRLLVAMYISESLENGNDDRLLEAAKFYKVDVAKIRKSIADQEKAAKAPKAAKAKAVIKKAKKKTKAKPQFMQPMQPAPALAAIVGDKPLARTEITSKLWMYIKKNDLQDKTNRRMINIDAKFRELKGVDAKKKQVSMFEFTKIVSKNIATAKAKA
jgi:ParB/RepB/Spo0J family partition protein